MHFIDFIDGCVWKCWGTPHCTQWLIWFCWSLSRFYMVNDHYPVFKWLAIIGKINPTFSGPNPDVWRMVIKYVTIICDLSLHHSSHQGQKAPAGRVVLCHQPKELWACLPGGTLRCHQTWREEIPEINGGSSWENQLPAHFWRQTVLRSLTIRQVTKFRDAHLDAYVTITSRWHVRPDGMIIVVHDVHDHNNRSATNGCTNTDTIH